MQKLYPPQVCMLSQVAGLLFSAVAQPPPDTFAVDAEKSAIRAPVHLIAVDSRDEAHQRQK